MSSSKKEEKKTYRFRTEEKKTEEKKTYTTWGTRKSSKGNTIFFKKVDDDYITIGYFFDKKKEMNKVWIMYKNKPVDCDLYLNGFLTDEDELQEDLLKVVDKELPYIFKSLREEK